MFTLFRFFSYWPLRALHALGGALGWLVWACSPGYRRRFRANVAQAGLAFEVAKPAIAEAGRFVAELPKLWLRPFSESCLRNVQIQGQDHAERAFAQCKGVIFFGPHCGSFELGPQALAEVFGPKTGPITAIYRPARQPSLAAFELAIRQRPQLKVLPASLSAIKAMHKALKGNQAVALLTDQVPPQGGGVWAPFFGKSAYTMTLAARLAVQSGAAMLPVSCERLPKGRGYIVKIWPPVDVGVGFDKPDLLHAVTRINQAIEAIVSSQPGQYLWGYGRYKTPRQETPPKQSVKKDSV
jgi:KDO2-lipid IV(A) lauroyltransferase